MEARDNGWGNGGKDKDVRGNSRGRSKGGNHNYGREVEAEVVAAIV